MAPPAHQTPHTSPSGQSSESSQPSPSVPSPSPPRLSPTTHHTSYPGLVTFSLPSLVLLQKNNKPPPSRFHSSIGPWTHLSPILCVLLRLPSWTVLRPVRHTTDTPQTHHHHHQAPRFHLGSPCTHPPFPPILVLPDFIICPSHKASLLHPAVRLLACLFAARHRQTRPAPSATRSIQLQLDPDTIITHQQQTSARHGVFDSSFYSTLDMYLY